MQIAAGAHGACCAKLGEAEAVVRDGGLADVMVTTPIVGRAKLERLPDFPIGENNCDTGQRTGNRSLIASGSTGLAID